MFKKSLISSLICLILIGCGVPQQEKKSIQIKGSDTEVNVVQRLAESFMEKNPGVSIAVTGGGSGVGIAALIDKQIDIANSSRPMKEEELKLAKEKNVDPVGIVFAIDGLAIIVSEGIQIESLTLDELSKIFRGEITNFKEVGGPDIEISLYGRQSTSGTYAYFRDTIVKADYSPKIREMTGTAQIVEAVRKDKAGIGYVGIGYVKDDEGKVIEGIRVINIAKDKNSPPISPLDSEKVKGGIYPISRPLYQFINGKPQGVIRDFIQFELSEEGQKIIEKEGFYPISEEYMEMNRKLLE